MKNRHTIYTTILFALTCFAFSPQARAVVPAPDGGYPGYNTAEGQNALFSRTTGVWNTALGAFTLFGDTTGTGNTAVGINGLRNNVTGQFNTAAGLNALYFNNGDPAAGTGSENSAFGATALFHNTTGAVNCAFGANALFHNSTGSANCAFGEGALYVNTAGFYNTAIGRAALFGNTGSDNTAVGTVALGGNGDGIQNTATGMTALGNNSSGNFNTATGFQALFANDTGSANTAVGVNALQLTSAGGANTALGFGAGANVTSGSFNVYIGTDVGGVTNEVGHTYISNISSTVQPPGGSVEYVTINLDTKLLGHASSSRRYKEDIKSMSGASEALYRLKPVSYRYKKKIDPNQSAAFGLIAEEVAAVNPALVARDPEGQPESVHYEMVNAMLLNEFLKEHRKVQELEKGMAALTAELKEQAAQIEKVSARVQITGPATKVVLNNQYSRSGHRLRPGSPTPATAPK